MSLSLFNLLITWSLIGLIWVIQLVHYPSFAYVDEDLFSNFHRHHTFSISLIVMPLMLLEVTIAAFLLYQHGHWTYLVPFLLVIGIWLATFLIAVPLHNQLANGKDIILINQLVQTNWIRTILWTIKGLWLGYVFWEKQL